MTREAKPLDRKLITRPFAEKSLGEKTQITHRYLRRKGHYRFVGGGLLKLILGLALLGGAVWAFNRYVYDLGTGIDLIFDQFSIPGIFAVFFASESLLGMIPIDLFIAWAGQLPQPVAATALLAVLSYAGGVVSYYEGRWLGRFPKVQAWLARKYPKLWENFLRYGWLFISIAAITPLPFSPVCLIAGMLGTSKKVFFLSALTRLGRYALYGWVLFQVLGT